MAYSSGTSAPNVQRATVQPNGPPPTNYASSAGNNFQVGNSSSRAFASIGRGGAALAGSKPAARSAPSRPASTPAKSSTKTTATATPHAKAAGSASHTAPASEQSAAAPPMTPPSFDSSYAPLSLSALTSQMQNRTIANPGRVVGKNKNKARRRAG